MNEHFESWIDTNAYNEGYRAYEMGKARYDNPYPYETSKYKSWMRGYTDAQKDKLDE